MSEKWHSRGVSVFPVCLRGQTRRGVTVGVRSRSVHSLLLARHRRKTPPRQQQEKAGAPRCGGPNRAVFGRDRPNRRSSTHPGGCHYPELTLAAQSASTGGAHLPRVCQSTKPSRCRLPVAHRFTKHQEGQQPWLRAGLVACSWPCCSTAARLLQSKSEVQLVGNFGLRRWTPKPTQRTCAFLPHVKR